MSRAARIALLALAACEPARPAAVPAASAGTSLALDLGVPFAELEIPADSRDGRAPPETIALAGPWELLSGTDQQRKYRATLPVRPRALFFHKPPGGMDVRSAKGEVRHATRGLGWSYDQHTITATVGLADDAPSDWSVAYPAARAREAALNYAFSGKTSPEAFVRAEVNDGVASRTGLLVPAPGHVAVDVAVPAAAELWFDVGLVPPETLDAAPSDGAVASVEITDGGATRTVWTRALTADAAFEGVHVDLSAYAGRTVRIRLRTEPGATSRFDYVFFGEPVLAPRKADPKRVVYVFADTVRRDHLGLYGYARDTSKPVDDWAAGGVVFDQARSVAPWTLPTARSLLTGRHPEEWYVATTLQRTLREEGFATAAFGANVYLSSNFQMQRDFGVHQVDRVAGNVVIDRALDWLAAHEGRDAFLMVQLMDAHLPYKEPAAYRYRYATPGQEGEALLPEKLERRDVTKLRGGPPPAVRQYVIDRYDQNVAFLNDEVGRLLRHTRDDDVVVYFADHGEEFWEHGGFEHGHTLFDELLRVPLVVKAPGIAPARVQEPVSLIDVAPTVLDLLDVEQAGLDGVSLAPAMADPAARPPLAERDLAFGRPLYGSERWGVLHADQKYATFEGREVLYDLASDPAEKTDLLGNKPDAECAPWRPILAAAVERDVALGYRLLATRATGQSTEITAALELPGGVRRAWVGADPTDLSAATVTVEGEVATARWLAGSKGQREVFVVPERPVADTTHTLWLRTSNASGEEVARQVSANLPALPGAVRGPMMRGPVPGGRVLAMSFAVTVAPDPDDTPVRGADDEVRHALEALGYVFDDVEP